MPGFPIRTPWDHSLVDSSPRPIAASHVLHRLLVPRHPPFALDNLTTKMLASTVQFSTNDQPTTRTAPHQTPLPWPVCRARPCLATIPKPEASGHGSEKTTDGCSFRTQQGAIRQTPAASHPSFLHPEGRVLDIRDRCRRPTHQCLRHRAPHHHVRMARAPCHLSVEGAP